MIIAIDFDGTCVEHNYPRIGATIPHAIEVLKELVASGHKLILWTCRENHPTDAQCMFLDDAVQWFQENEIELHGVNCTPVEDDFRDWFPNPTTIRKAYADVYIDDRNFGGFPGWLTIRKELVVRRDRQERDTDWIRSDESQDARDKINGPWVAVLNQEIIASAISLTKLHEVLDIGSMDEKPVFWRV